MADQMRELSAYKIKFDLTKSLTDKGLFYRPNEVLEFKASS